MILASCSVEKNTDTSRFYHSMTARYNIYFNGYESFKSGILKINNGYKDDFGELLNVFEFSDPATISLCSSDMEKAIQKASKLITLKSITTKPEFKNKKTLTDKEKTLLEQKEYNEWVDDSYLLIGKARFYKHDYNESKSVLNYCINQANDPLIKIEANIWLVRLYTETGNYNESFRILSEAGNTPGLIKPIRSMYFASLADLFIRQKRYSEALEPLRKSIELASGKRNRYRLTYLLAQISEKTGDITNATKLYKEVIKLNPPYEVEFNARINIAGVFDINSQNPSAIQHELEKMLKDVKNKDFQDQIYFALANLLIREGKEKEGLEFFRKSVASESSNANQKGRSYLALADYYYKKPDYMKAGTYYDSAIFFIDQKRPEFQSLKNKSINLNTLVSQLTIIQTQDSLQKVAKMPDQDRRALISTIIEKKIKDESESKVIDNADRTNIGQFYENERRFQGNIESEGKWYFYNQAALTFGRTEFKRRWGGRKLEDNWRRLNKAKVSSSSLLENPEILTNKKADTSKAALDYKKPEFYLKNLPLTDSLLLISDEKIANALLNAGKAYSEKIQDPVKATQTLEQLISRFPKSELIPETLYNIYNINKTLNNSKAEICRQRLLKDFPDNEFAKILSDPAWLEKKIANQKQSENLYQDAYKSYSSEKFSETISMCEEGLSKFPLDPLAPKFKLLKAYSVARISDERLFKEELSELIKAFPQSDESKKASDLIAFLNKKTPELKVEEDKKIASEIFRADTTTNHVFALIIPDPSFNINQATFDVISFNIDNYTNKNFKTEGTLVDNKYIIITVAGFADYAQTLAYYRSFRVEKTVRNPSGAKMMSFIINSQNLNALNSDKNPERYLLFFKENYLK